MRILRRFYVIVSTLINIVSARLLKRLSEFP
jgi:hypothetical protein